MTILNQIWNIPDGFATLLAGSFVIFGAILAWRSVQQQIRAADKLERARIANEIVTLQAGFTAEMLVFSRGIIQATSHWNKRGRDEPKKVVTTNWPLFQDPLFYRTNITKIGVLSPPWVGTAIVGFYSNLLECNDQSREALAGRPTVNVTSESIAERLRLMSANLSQALDGLNADRKFPIPRDLRLESLFMPDGSATAAVGGAPRSLQDVLLKLAGMHPPAAA